MNALLLKIREQHWETRSASERKTILFGAFILLPFILYFLLWQPSHEATDKLRLALPVLRLQTEQMHHAANLVADLRHRPQLAVLDSNAVKAAIEESATRNQLRNAITTLDVQEPNGVRISISAVSFQKWLEWLRELDQSLHIRADSVAITSLSESGMVSIRATLTNGNTL